MTLFRRAAGRTARVLPLIARTLWLGLTYLGYWTAGYPPIPADDAGTGRAAGTEGQAPHRDTAD